MLEARPNFGAGGDTDAAVHPLRSIGYAFAAFDPAGSFHLKGCILFYSLRDPVHRAVPPPVLYTQRVRSGQCGYLQEDAGAGAMKGRLLARAGSARCGFFFLPLQGASRFGHSGQSAHTRVPGKKSGERCPALP